MTLDTRALRLLVLSAWSIFLLWLWASDEVLRYLGPRTQWVVPAGAVALGAAALLYARGTGPDDHPLRPSFREVAGSVALLLPILMAAILSGASLGSLAASQKLSARGVDLSALARLHSGDTGQVTFLDLEGAAHDAQLAKERGIRPGAPIQLSGFVTHAGRDHFEIARFYIACCVADAIPVGVTVLPGTTRPVHVERDEWVTVTGAIARQADHYAVRGLRVTKINQPKHPYLYFGR
jgi:uncharacterized repeat protein (TIGR03943 family)